MNPKRLFSPREHKAEEEIDAENPFLESGKILDAEPLKKGGKIVIIPFKAGPGVEADSEMDRVVLMIVKGAAETLQDKSSRFEILLSHNAEEADLMVEGRIIGFRKPSRLKKWLPGGKRISVIVEGKMIDVKTGNPVLVFTDKKETTMGKENHLQLALRIGEDISRFILSGAE